MKKLRIVSLASALILLCALLAGCGTAAGSAGASLPAGVSSGSTPPAEGSITVTDMMGRKVVLPQAAGKVVALSAADCEIIYALDAGKTIVGRGEYCNYPEEVLAVESVQSGNETNAEQILALGPDVVFMSTMAQSPEVVDQLEAAGVAVVVSEAADIAGVYQSIRLIGACLGRDAEAANLVAEMEQDFEQAADMVPQEAEAQSVYFEVSPLEWGLWTAGSNTFMDEIATMLKLENSFADVQGWAEISEEQVIERNPDYIVTIAMYSGEGPLPEEEIAARSGWQNIAAVQNGNIFLLNSDELSRPGPRLAQAAKELAQLVYAPVAA